MTVARMPVILLALTAIAGTAGAKNVSLSKDVMPIFTRSCVGCHQQHTRNRKIMRNHLFFETKQDILHKVGSMIIPGKPKKSYLFLVIDKSDPKNPVKTVMPPPRSRAPKLSKDQIKKISDWIKAGAKDN